MAYSDDYNELIGDYKPGSVTNVKLKNFLTYSHVEFQPGPRLNMVIGANGTGKSTILCAICLGLGGEPKLLGRADDARAFIMHDKDSALIEITLAPFPGKKVQTIQRIIDGSKGSERGNGRGASTFFIIEDKREDKKTKKTIKEVQNLVKETYNITIDNLCTFLPQDKVGSFSGFDQQSLLTETEKTLSGSQHLYNQHMELIEAELELNSGDHNVETIQSKLEKLNTEKDKFEREKARMEEREEAVRQAELLRKKIMWLEFNELQAKVKKLKDEKAKVRDALKESQQSLQPLEDKLDSLNHRKQELDSQYKALDQQTAKHKKNIQKYEKKATTHDDNIENKLVELKQLDSERNKKRADYEKAKERHASIQKSIDDLPPTEQIEKEFTEVMQAKKSSLRSYSAAKAECNRLQQEFRDLEDNAHRVEAKLSKLQDEREQRKTQFLNNSPAHVRKAYAWLQENKKNFRRPVYGPVGIEVSVATQNAAAFLEHHVPNSLLRAFIVEDKEDYDRLYNEVRQKLNIPINITLIRNGQLQEIQRQYSDAKMDILKREHGVIGYLDEAFKAPDAVLQALCSVAQVHKVLVGGEATQRSIDDKGLLNFLAAPEGGRTGVQGSCIFSSMGQSSKCYRSDVSRYSKKINTRIDFVSPPRALAKVGNPQEKTDLQENLKQIHDNIRSLRPSIEDAENQKAHFEAAGQELGARAAKAKESKELHSTFMTKLKNAESRLREAEKELEADDSSTKRDLVKQIMNLVEHTISAYEAHGDSHDQLMESTFSSAGMRIDKDKVALKVRQVEADLLEQRRAYQHLETQARQLSQTYLDKRNELKQLSIRNTEAAPLKAADGQTLPLWDMLNELEYESIEDAEAALEEVEQKINSFHHDPNAIKQYEATMAEIKKVQDQLDIVQGSKDAWDQKIQQIKAPWQQALENSIHKVNALFVNYMGEVGCTGEVRLKKGGESGDEDRDFRHWGIEIRVSFREGVKAQVLSAQVQSGGERSVSTILFLMALQEMMVAPFRCVDEINQGLDERNERLVFRRIVQNSTRPPNAHPTDHSGQYFLITPKLLPNMVDMENEAVTTLTVFNGAFNFDSPTDFSVASLVAAAERFGKKRSMDDDEENEEAENIPPPKSRRSNGKKRRS